MFECDDDLGLEEDIVFTQETADSDIVGPTGNDLNRIFKIPDPEIQVNPSTSKIGFFTETIKSVNSFFPERTSSNHISAECSKEAINNSSGLNRNQDGNNKTGVGGLPKIVSLNSEFKKPQCGISKGFRKDHQSSKNENEQNSFWEDDVSDTFSEEISFDVEQSKMVTKPKDVRRAVPAKRKFPGPAGILPESVELTKSFYDNTDVESHQTNDMPLIDYPCTQDNSQFSGQLWSRMCSDFSGGRIFLPDRYNIAWIKKQAAAKIMHNHKAPFLAAIITHLEQYTSKTPNVIATLKDATGEISASLHSNLYETHKQDLVVGSVIVLRDFSVLTIIKSGNIYLTITKRNVLTVYSQTGSRNETQQTQPEYTQAIRSMPKVTRIQNYNLSAIIEDTLNYNYYNCNQNNPVGNQINNDYNALEISSLNQDDHDLLQEFENDFGNEVMFGNSGNACNNRFENNENSIAGSSSKSGFINDQFNMNYENNNSLIDRQIKANFRRNDELLNHQRINRNCGRNDKLLNDQINLSGSDKFLNDQQTNASCSRNRNVLTDQLVKESFSRNDNLLNDRQINTSSRNIKILSDQLIKEKISRNDKLLNDQQINANCSKSNTLSNDQLLNENFNRNDQQINANCSRNNKLSNYQQFKANSSGINKLLNNQQIQANTNRKNEFKEQVEENSNRNRDLLNGNQDDLFNIKNCFGNKNGGPNLSNLCVDKNKNQVRVLQNEVVSKTIFRNNNDHNFNATSKEDFIKSKDSTHKNYLENEFNNWEMGRNSKQINNKFDEYSNNFKNNFDEDNRVVSFKNSFEGSSNQLKGNNPRKMLIDDSLQNPFEDDDFDDEDIVFTESDKISCFNKIGIAGNVISSTDKERGNVCGTKIDRNKMNCKENYFQNVHIEGDKSINSVNSENKTLDFRDLEKPVTKKPNRFDQFKFKKRVSDEGDKGNNNSRSEGEEEKSDAKNRSDVKNEMHSKNETDFSHLSINSNLNSIKNLKNKENILADNIESHELTENKVDFLKNRKHQENRRTVNTERILEFGRRNEMNIMESSRNKRGNEIESNDTLESPVKKWRDDLLSCSQLSLEPEDQEHSQILEETFAGVDANSFFEDF